MSDGWIIALTIQFFLIWVAVIRLAHVVDKLEKKVKNL